MSPLERDRSRLSGLHFAQDAMRPRERETLHLAEAMLVRIDRVLALCDDESLGDHLYPDDVRAALTDT